MNGKKNGSMIIERVTEIRSGRNQVVGVFVGKLHCGKLVSGWSRVKDGSGDEFDMKKGIKYAIANGVENKDIPFKKSLKDYSDKYRTFRNRCLRYFKGFDFNGRTDKSYSLKDFAGVNVNQEKEQVKDANTVDMESPLAKFVTAQLQGMGIDNDMIEKFVRASLPIAEKLSAKGVTGIALPLNVNSADFIMQLMGGMGLGTPAHTM